MNKKRILMCNEAHFLSTGYAIYGKEVLSRLHATGKYEVGELATYISPNDSRIGNCPWKIYANAPNPDSPEFKNYNENSTAVFGEWSFERVCLDFQPDIVFCIFDYWMLEYQNRSAYRPCYNWAIMPPADGTPQQEGWIDVYSKAQAVLTYTDWSGEVLNKQSGNQIKWCGSASPSAGEHLFPLPNRKEIKKLLGLGPDIKVIGTVMRNQQRKLYPELFRVFRQYLDLTKSKNTILYCHTAYPDNGWDIPYLIKEFGLSSKVFLTYTCENQQCRYAYPSVFQDAMNFCPRCHQKSVHTANPQMGVSHDLFNKIYNMMDLYVQFSSNEGFGIPVVEAAACGTPVTMTDYSAMYDIVRKLEGYPIKVVAFTRDLNTGMDRARPSDDHLLEIMTNFFNMSEEERDLKRQQTRQAFEKHYSWDRTASKWMSVFDSLPKGNWKLPPRIFSPAQPTEQLNNLSNAEYARWLIINVLCEPEKLGTYFESRIIRDLNYGAHIIGMGGQYYNEQSAQFEKPNFQKFDRQIAYQEMYQLCQRRNYFENMRKERLGL